MSSQGVSLKSRGRLQEEAELVLGLEHGQDLQEKLSREEMPRA